MKGVISIIILVVVLYILFAKNHDEDEKPRDHKKRKNSEDTVYIPSKKAVIIKEIDWIIDWIRRNIKF